MSISTSSISPLPGVIASLAFLHLANTGLLSHLTGAFFNLQPMEQIGLLSLLFSLVFFAVQASTVFSPTLSPGQRAVAAAQTTKQQIEYPLPELNRATTDKEKFKLLFPHLRDEILRHVSSTLSNDDIPPTHECMAWLGEMMDYNVPGGKLNRGLTVVDVHRTLVRANQDGRDLTNTEIARASVLGWAIEFLQAFFLVADDVMDDSETRRGQPCWYKVPKVGVIAINDSFLLESFVFTLLKNHFGHEPYYDRLVELFLEVVQKTEMGQLLDLTSQPLDVGKKGGQKPDLTQFTIDRHGLIVKYKTAFYTFYLPVAIGMITSGVTSPEAYDLAKRICCIMGEYFQIQDDYLDCYGDPDTIGKVGTDIQDNKCSWLVVQALDRATPAQRKILEDNYGVWDDKKVRKVKDLYNELKLQQVFDRYEEESYRQIQAELDKVKLMPRDVFELLLNRIYKRSK